MLVYACGVCNKIPEKSRIPVSMSWVHAVIFAHWKEQKYWVSAGMFPPSRGLEDHRPYVIKEY